VKSDTPSDGALSRALTTDGTCTSLAQEDNPARSPGDELTDSDVLAHDARR
jgi:hypothetical protein